MSTVPPDAPQDYRATVRLPRTDFPMRANLPQLEPRLLARWEEQRLAARVLERNAGRPLYVLHDGPPYANGDIHHGHILNKTLKDVVVKYRNMAGFLAHLVPGWDCHGLPIELNVDKALTAAQRAGLSRQEIRARCRVEAEKWIAVQRAQFKRLGVLASWDHAYLTMDPKYEAAVVRELARFADGGGLYRSVKPVHWCWSCKTALAEAEVEHTLAPCPSAYVPFPIADAATRTAMNPALHDATVWLLVWTTTPWTLPASRAVGAGSASFEYCAYKLEGSTARVVVAAPCHAAVEQALGLRLTQGVPVDLDAVCSGDGKSTLGAQHPFLQHQGAPMAVPIIKADHVSLDHGTGLVQVAPAHSPEDYAVGKKLGFDIVNPVSDEGCYLHGMVPDALAGLHVLKEGNAAVLALLARAGLAVGPPQPMLDHQSPHCWRCHHPVILRATLQWFISMESPVLRSKALHALSKVHFVPAWGRERLAGMLAARPDWCISRQRAWGVPIPAVTCAQCGHCHATRASFEHVATVFETQGSDSWWTLPMERLIPLGLRCPQCGAASWRREEDIVDVWFESGASFAAVLQSGGLPHLQIPADLYLEGSDQHRGWFHSALLISVGGRGELPYKSVLTHGFVVDGQGLKYSKSSPNSVALDAVVEEHGVELLRLWVAATDYTRDLRLSQEILSRLAEGYLKFRNTLRFMLGNLHPEDFDARRDAVPRERMPLLDRYILARLSALIGRVVKAYEEHQFHLVVQALNEFVSTELSAFYLDVQKDTLYCDAVDSPRRRSAQTTLHHLARALMSLMAPILSFTAEEAWAVLPDDGTKEDSVHLSRMPMRLDGYDREDAPQVLQFFDRVLKVRANVQKALEPFRALGHHSLAAAVTLSCPFELRDFLGGFQDELAGLFLVSQVELVEQVKDDSFVDAASQLGMKTKVGLATGLRCARCWVVGTQVGLTTAHPMLCPRCAGVLGGQV